MSHPPSYRYSTGGFKNKLNSFIALFDARVYVTSRPKRKNTNCCDLREWKRQRRVSKLENPVSRVRS